MWLIRLLGKIKRKHPFPRTPSDNLINISLDHDVKLQQNIYEVLMAHMM